MRRGLWVAIAALAVVFLAVLLVFGSYVSAKNQMVTKREAVTSSWSEVNNQMQRRADLIPNLVETVKGYAKQETTVFGDIANARAGLLNAHGDPKATIQANGALDGALGRLLALTENYPDLKSNANFQRLSDELAGTENRISVARMRYNQNIQDYNTFIGQFPNSIWAGMGGFQRNNDYFQASPALRTCPRSASKASGSINSAVPAWPGRLFYLRSRLGASKGSHCTRLVVLDVENRVELGDLQQVVNLLGEIEQLKVSALVAHGGKRADQLADTRAVDISHVTQVEQDLLGAFAEEIPHGVAQLHTAFSQGNAAATIHNGDPVHLTGLDFHAHEYSSLDCGTGGS